MNSIKNVIETNNYFTECAIEKVLTDFNKNFLEVHISKNESASNASNYKLRFKILNSFTWDNSKFNQLVKNINISPVINHIIFKEEEGFNMIKFILNDNRILSVSYKEFHLI